MDQMDGKALGAFATGRKQSRVPARQLNKSCETTLTFNVVGMLNFSITTSRTPDS
jgi:hypothetical protein